jgi:uncharacterized membrane protein YheB (UPF0754 family)
MAEKTAVEELVSQLIAADTINRAVDRAIAGFTPEQWRKVTDVCVEHALQKFAPGQFGDTWLDNSIVKKLVDRPEMQESLEAASARFKELLNQKLSNKLERWAEDQVQQIIKPIVQRIGEKLTEEMRKL